MVQFFIFVRIESSGLQSRNALTRQKQEARHIAKAKRDILHRDFSDSSVLDIEAATKFIEAIDNSDIKTIAGYWPIGSEFDPRKLLFELQNRGHIIVLPVIAGREKPLIFRRWTPDSRMETGDFNVLVPPEDAEVITPTILLTPLLAFDNSGYRLGYGGGFYDRTLEMSRKSENIKSIGMAFSAQHMAKVPTDHYDQPLDALITEAFIREFT